MARFRQIIDEFFCKGERNDCKYVSATIDVISGDIDLRVRDIFIQRIEENYDYEETRKEIYESEYTSKSYIHEYSLIYDEFKRIDASVESIGSSKSLFSSGNRSTFLSFDASRKFDREYFEYMYEKRKSLDEQMTEEESCEEKRRRGLTTFCI